MTILRALAGSVKLPQRVPQAARSSGLDYGISGLLGGGDQAGMEAYKSVGSLYGPIRRIAEVIALCDWTLYEQTDTKGKTDRRLIDDAIPPARHPATALWTQPNPFMNRWFFLFLNQLWQETAGGCYWLICQAAPETRLLPSRPKVTSDLELWPIRPGRITPVTDPDQYIAGYLYSFGTERIPLETEWVIPVGLPDPTDPTRFAGPIQAVLTDAESDRYAAQYQRNLFYNDARPGGVIETAEPLPPDRWEELVTRWREQHQGVSNARRVAILEAATWKDVGHSNEQMQYKDLRILSREQFMFAMGMPFAIMMSNDVNLANAQQADKSLSRYTARPRLEYIKQPLNSRILPYFGDNLTFDYTLPAPEDSAFDVYSAATGFLAGGTTLNEFRDGLGRDAVEGPEGDQYLWQISGTLPTPMTAPPRKPVTFSYRQKARHPHAAQTEGLLQAAWTARLKDVREQYLALLEGRRSAA